MSGNLLNKEDYQNVLLNCFCSADLQFVNSKIAPLSENVEGVLGEHYKLKISYKINNETKYSNFFLKTIPSQSQYRKDICEIYKVYPKEILFYEVILNEIKIRGYDVSFAPKCYLSKNQQTIVMEDLFGIGFSSQTRNVPFDLSRCECMLKSLAKFHAGGYMLEETKSKELGRKYRLDEDYGHLFNEVMFDGTELMFSYFKTMKKLCEYFIDTIPRSMEFREDFKKRLKDSNVEEIFFKTRKYRGTLGHGDLWSNNMMFIVQNDVATDCCLVDFQTLRYHHPGFDVLSGLLQNTTAAFRSQYTDYLIQYYYGCLSDQLKQQGYSITEIMPLHDFLEGIKLSDFPAKFQALGYHVFSLMPQSDFNEIMNTRNEALKTSYIGYDIKKFIAAYNKYDVYKEVILDDLYEIYKSLQNI